MTRAGEIAARLADVNGRIAAAATRSGRSPAGVLLVAVGKTYPLSDLQAAYAAGARAFGENRVQEAEEKFLGLPPDAMGHLIGPLQSNKARRAIETFAVIQTVDSVELAVRLDRIAAEIRPGRPLPVLLQVNVDGDPAKAGFPPDHLVAAADALDGCAALEFRGLMTVGRLVDRPADARPTFAALRERSASLRAEWPRLGPDLSMGMSDDYPIAIEEGATIVRVGRALFGDRV